MRSVNYLRVFVASPSDVEEERSMLEEIINSENLSWEKAYGFRLELVKWETHTYPNVGSEPQDIINKQIDDDYDIFIGIMWTRAGTKTKEHDSGTIEEFRRAYNRYVNGDEITIMFYFNNAPQPIDSLDLEQLKAIKTFKDEIGHEGTYYWNYNGAEAFEKCIRNHLNLLLIDLKNKSKLNRVSEIEREITVATGDESEDKGIVDILEDCFDEMEIVEDSINRIIEFINELVEHLNNRTEEINQIGEPLSSRDVKKMKLCFNRVAYDMDSFCLQATSELEVFDKNINKFFDDIVKGTMMLYELDGRFVNKTEIASMNAQIIGVKQIIKEAIMSLEIMENEVNSIPNIQSNVNKAKKNVVGVIEKIISEFKMVTETISKIDINENNNTLLVECRAVNMY